MTTRLSVQAVSGTGLPAPTAERSYTSTMGTSHSAPTHAARPTRLRKPRPTRPSSSRPRTPTNERIQTGEGWHRSLLDLARKHYPVRYRAVKFVDEVFVGTDPQSLQRKRQSAHTSSPLLDGTLTRAGVRAYAQEWDALGLTRPELFVEAFECEVLGTTRGNNYQQIMNVLSADSEASSIDYLHDPVWSQKPHWED